MPLLLEEDTRIALPEHGLRLAFDPGSQRLRLIEILDADRLAVVLHGRRLFGGVAAPPRLGAIYQELGPTCLTGQGDEADEAFPLLYPGVLFLFPQQQQQQQQQQRGARLSAGALPEGAFCADAIARRVVVFAGLATSAAAALSAAPPPPAPRAVEGRPRPGAAPATLYAVAGRGLFGLGPGCAALELGASLQQVLALLGPPWRVRRVRGPPAAAGRYALAYPALGTDVVLDARRHAVDRLVLHANVPGSPAFGLVERCDAVVLADEAELWSGAAEGAGAGGSASGDSSGEGMDVAALDSDLVGPLPREHGSPMSKASSDSATTVSGPKLAACFPEHALPAAPVPIPAPTPTPTPIPTPAPPVPTGKKKGKKGKNRGAVEALGSSSASSSSLGSAVPSLSSSPGLLTPSPLHDAPALRQAASRLGGGPAPRRAQVGSDTDVESVRGPSEGWSDADDLTALVMRASACGEALSVGVQAGDEEDGLVLGALDLDDAGPGPAPGDGFSESLCWDGSVAAYVVPGDIELADPGAEAAFERVPLQRDCATQTQRRRAAPDALVVEPRPFDVAALAARPGVAIASGAAAAGRLPDDGAFTLLHAYRGAVFETLPAGQIASVTLFRP
ncbi:hypothetical protein QBZ16_005420 [Prototheca wickerhamii]|uniref:Uncharacterized protein n=1 Tax=Prototheca wickerhamii TaxID=3111 RepID=A0AAD9IG87_PROWI|nr:hypothetical protein QBZ16_005420 [Prototheca wickerhamii]